MGANREIGTRLRSQKKAAFYLRTKIHREEAETLLSKAGVEKKLCVYPHNAGKDMFPSCR